MLMIIPRKTIGVILAVILLCTSTACRGSSQRDQVQTEEDSIMEHFEYIAEIAVNWTDYLQNSEGEITDEPYGYLRFVVSGDVEQFKQELTDVCGKPLQLTVDQIPGYMGHDIAKKLISEMLVSTWNVFRDGRNGEKTRSIELYLTQDEDGTYYFYYFG